MTIHRRLIEGNLRSPQPLRPCHSRLPTVEPHYSDAWLFQSGIMLTGDIYRFQLCPEDAHSIVSNLVSLLNATQALKMLWCGVPFLLAPFDHHYKQLT
ncbi:hypothetical protein TNCV_718811 [Trichonephila clavipes]|nr:hypothetical protein TNCV_718811 [Trichonephila clavipes]